MKVYIVTSGEYSDYGIDAVFLDRKKAEAYARYHTEGWGEPRVEAYDASDDLIPANPSGYLTFVATGRVPRDGPARPDVRPPYLTLDDRSLLTATRMSDGSYHVVLRRSYPESSPRGVPAPELFARLASDEFARLDALARAGDRLDLLYPIRPTETEVPE